MSKTHPPKSKAASKSAPAKSPAKSAVAKKLPNKTLAKTAKKAAPAPSSQKVPVKKLPATKAAPIKKAASGKTHSAKKPTPAKKIAPAKKAAAVKKAAPAVVKKPEVSKPVAKVESVKPAAKKVPTPKTPVKTSPKTVVKAASAPEVVDNAIAAPVPPVMSDEVPVATKTGALFYDSHMHTPLCKHAVGDPEEYAAQGLKSGLKGIIFTCHCPMPDGFWPSVRMSDSEFDTYLAIVKRTADAYRGKLDVCLGLESEFFPGHEKWIERLHKRADFDYILGAVHWQSKDYLAKFETGTIENFRRTYFEHLAQSAETGLYDCLAHPDLVKNYHPDSWCFAIIKNTVTTVLDRIAKTGVAMELNTSGLNKSYSEMNPGNEMLRMMAERNIPIVVGSDAHKPVRVGEHLIPALNNLSEAGYEKVSYFKKRQRIDLKISDVLASLRKAIDANS